MISVVRAAARGERKAMQSLYNANKQTVWCVAQGLLLDPEQASGVTSSVFRELWRDLKRGKFEKKEDFTNAAVSKTAEQCVAIILKKSPKAFRLPHDKNFHLPEYTPINPQCDRDIDFYLSNLPPLQRLIFVLHTIGTWGALRIAKVLGWDSAIIRSAIQAESENFSLLQKLAGREPSATYQEILALFDHWKAETKLPEHMDQANLKYIESQVSPQAESAKRTKLAILLFCVVILLALLPFIIQIAQRKAAQKAADVPTTAPVSMEDTEPTKTQDEVTEPTLTYDPPKLDSDVTYFAYLDVDGYDTIVIQLDHKAAPITCAYFVEKAIRGDYDQETTIYSITDGSMIQGGKPTAIVKERIVGEFSENGYDNPLLHTAGAISMVREDEYDSASGAFSILRTDRPDMDGKYAVFGYVIEGMDVLDQIYYDMMADEDGNIAIEDQPLIDILIREKDNYEYYDDE